MQFNPKTTQDAFYEFNFKQFDRRINTFDPQQPIGNFALHMLDIIISGYLVHLNAKVRIYLPTVHTWLDIAIANGEQFGEQLGEDHDLSAHPVRLLQGKAIALWMTEQINAKPQWQQARQLSFDQLRADELCPDKLYLDQSRADLKHASAVAHIKKKLPTAFLDDYLQLCLQSEQYQAGIDLFESYYGQKQLSIKRKMTARQYAYVCCLNALTPQYSQQQMQEAGQKMLSQYMQSWLQMGAYRQAATWLKIVYWDHQATTTVDDTILKAYACMPAHEKL